MVDVCECVYSIMVDNEKRSVRYAFVVCNENRPTACATRITNSKNVVHVHVVYISMLDQHYTSHFETLPRNVFFLHSVRNENQNCPNKTAYCCEALQLILFTWTLCGAVAALPVSLSKNLYNKEPLLVSSMKLMK